MIRIFMSYGMNGRTEEEQRTERSKLRKKVEELFNDKENAFRLYKRIWNNKHGKAITDTVTRDLQGYCMNPMRHVRLVDNHDAAGDKKDGRLYYLGQAIMKLDKCDAIIFASDWEKHKGCRIEHHIAETYEIPILYCE